VPFGTAAISCMIANQVHPILPGDHCVRSSRTAGAACAQPEPECLCGALGQVGEGGVQNIRRGGPVQCRERLGGLLRYYHQEAA
jgi:hypothetical protein